MMREVLSRRFRRMAKSAGGPSSNGSNKAKGSDSGSWGIVPDLVLIDGGKGHLGAALQVFLELGIDSVPLASLAKENEELFVPQVPEPIVLPRGSQGLFLVQAAPRRGPPLRRYLPPAAPLEAQRTVRPRPGSGHRPEAQANAHPEVRVRQGDQRGRAGGDRRRARHDDEAGANRQELPLVDAVRACFCVYVRCPPAIKGSVASTPSYVWPEFRSCV